MARISLQEAAARAAILINERDAFPIDPRGEFHQRMLEKARVLATVTAPTPAQLKNLAANPPLSKQAVETARLERQVTALTKRLGELEAAKPAPPVLIGAHSASHPASFAAAPKPAPVPVAPAKRRPPDSCYRP